MKRLPRAAVSIATGVGMFFFTDRFIPSLDRSPEKTNQEVRACAAQLGATVTKSATVPQACEADGGWIADTFTYTERVSTKYSQVGGPQELSRTISYELPSSHQLLQNQIIDPVKENSDRNRSSRNVGELFGILLAAVEYNVLRPPKTQLQVEEATDSPV